MARLTAEAKVRRDDKIVADRARGMRWQTIAARYDLSERQARAVWAERLRSEPIERLEGRDALAQAILEADASIEELAVLAQETRHDAVRLGAIRARVTAMAERTDLLRLAGVVPFSPRQARTEAELREVIDSLLEVFQRHCTDPRAIDELLEAIETASIAT